MNKGIGIILSIGICLNTMPITLAEGTEVVGDGKSSTEVTKNINSSFSVLIPQNVALNGDSIDFSIQAKGNIEPDKQLTVTNDGTATMTRANDATYISSATINIEGTIWDSTTLTNEYDTKNGTIAFPEAKAGSYSGTANFNINLEAKDTGPVIGTSYLLRRGVSGANMSTTLPYKDTAVGISFDRGMPDLTKIEFEDVSEAKDNSVIAYLDIDNIMHIASNEKIIFNSNSSNLFSGYYSVTDIKFNDNIDTSNVTDISYLFHGCENLESLDLTNFDTSKVTTMQGMFASSTVNTGIDLSVIDTSNVTDMSHMFYNGHTKKVNFTGINTSKVTDMSYMFYMSSNNELNLSSFDTSNVVDMQRMFVSTQVNTLDLSNFNTTNVTSMFEMFYNAFYLKTLDISSFNTSNVTNMSGMFKGTGLTTLNLSNFDTTNVTDMSEMFKKGGPFTANSFLTSIEFGNNFNTEKVTNMKGMFSGTKKLTSLDVSKFNTSNVTDMSGMFQECNLLTNIDVSNFDTSKVITMNAMFLDCKNITSLNVSNFDTSKVTNMTDMFANCVLLSTLDLSNFNTANVTSSARMFVGDAKLTTSIKIKGTKNNYYDNMFNSSATASPAKITVNYDSTNSSLVTSMIATKSAGSNVVKGTLIP